MHYYIVQFPYTFPYYSEMMMNDRKENERFLSSIFWLVQILHLFMHIIMLDTKNHYKVPASYLLKMLNWETYYDLKLKLATFLMKMVLVCVFSFLLQINHLERLGQSQKKKIRFLEYIQLSKIEIRSLINFAEYRNLQRAVYIYLYGTCSTNNPFTEIRKNLCIYMNKIYIYIMYRSVQYFIFWLNKSSQCVYKVKWIH